MNKSKTRLVAVCMILLTAFACLGCVATNDNEEGSNNNDSMESEILNAVTGTYNENNDKSTIYNIKGDTIIVELEENPTTGYAWNMNYSKGLELKNDSYTSDIDSEIVTGAGGIHQWTFEVTDSGEQSISAVYMRSWEEKTGEEDSFNLNVIALSEDELIVSSGTVAYLELEGGFYGIIAADEQHYDPINLDEELMVDGTEVEFIAYPRNDMMTIRMWGQLVEIRTIKKVSE